MDEEFTNWRIEFTYAVVFLLGCVALTYLSWMFLTIK